MRARSYFDASLFGTPQESAFSLLYRYWFWGWLFADASQRDLFRGAEALRYNIAHRSYLLFYVRRWMLCSLGLLLIGLRLEEGILPFWSTIAYTSGTLALTVLFVAAAEWLLLTAHDMPKRR